MSVLGKNIEDIKAQGHDAVVQHCKDLVNEYYETHTREEYIRFAAWLKYTFAKDRQGGVK